MHCAGNQIYRSHTIIIIHYMLTEKCSPKCSPKTRTNDDGLWTRAGTLKFVVVDQFHGPSEDLPTEQQQHCKSDETREFAIAAILQILRAWASSTSCPYTSKIMLQKYGGIFAEHVEQYLITTKISRNELSFSKFWRKNHHNWWRTQTNTSNTTVEAETAHQS